ncbi:MAG TPA: right-handed parallel beta-helix repeat-containing protein [Saprospiraceae bacterium]|nr:right-handed parallel beta-helix repeat-containing protein [Saprospiraceae bacterium]
MKLIKITQFNFGHQNDREYDPIYNRITFKLLIIFFLLLSNTSISAQVRSGCGDAMLSEEIKVGSNQSLGLLSDFYPTAATVWIVDGDLTIDVDDADINGVEFRMNEDANIYFSNIPSDCTIENSYFHGCSALWNGIDVNYSWRIKITDCTIEDAIEAIAVKTSFSNLIINENYFNNNKTCIRFYYGAFGIYSITHNKFYSDHYGVVDGTTTASGMIFSNHIPGVYIDGNLFDGVQNGISFYTDCMNLTYNNVYKNIVNDIPVPDDDKNANGNAVSINGYPNLAPTVYVKGKTSGTYDVGPAHDHGDADNFYNCVKGIVVVGGIGKISHNSITNCNYGVIVKLTQPMRFSQIAENTIENPHKLGLDFRLNWDLFTSEAKLNKININSSGNSNLIAAARVLATPSFETQLISIADNTISIANANHAVGIDLDGTAFTEVEGVNKINVASGNSYKGIHMHNKTNSCYVTGTEFSASDYTYSSTYTKQKIGLFVYDSENDIITCNKFAGTGIGLEIVENCGGSIFQHNEFNGGADGLICGSEYGWGSLIDEQYAAGNKWNSNCNHYDAATYGGITFGEFIVSPEDNLPSSNNLYWPNSLYPSNESFFYGLDGGANSPATGCGSGFLPATTLTGIQTKLINYDNSHIPSTDYFNWSSYWRIFDKFKSSPSILLNAAASDFLDDVSVNAEYKIWDIASQFHDVQVMDVSISDALDDIRSDKRMLYNDLATLIPAWAADPDDVTLTASIEDNISDISDLNDDETDILDDFNTRLQSDIADLLDDLDDITTSNDMDANMKYVLGIRINMTADAALSSGEIEDLEDIASQCHLDGGDAVYVARNILRSLGEEVDEDYDICNPLKPSAQTNINFWNYTIKCSKT